MKVGILGGGQLARMLALSAYPLGLTLQCLDPSEEATASELATFFKGEYTDLELLKTFSKGCDVITVETENIPVKSLEFLENLGVNVSPNSQSLYYSQDRLLEKSLCGELNIPTPAFISVGSPEKLVVAAKELSYPFIVKTCRFGYDGKGQWRITSPEDLAVLKKDFPQTPLIAEAFIAFEKEVSLISVRDKNGNINFYPLTLNTHKNGILICSEAPYENSSLEKSAREYATKIMKKLEYVGVLAIEFFVTKNGLLFNEMAPRVHNSGHWTMEGAVTSQFENHLRAILQLPLGSCELRTPSIMLNCLGKMPSLQETLSFKDCHIHDYKKASKPGRKVGHITLCGDFSQKDTLSALLEFT